MKSNTLKFINKFMEVKNLEIIESQSDIKRLSKDFYNYSPFLTEKLDECIADLVVRPSDHKACLLYTSPSPRDVEESRMPSSA